MREQQVIFFDGVCNFCNFWVNLILDRDKEQRFLFTPLQSEKAKELLAPHGVSTDAIDTVMLLADGKLYQRSGAALRIARYLGFPFNLFPVFLVIPPFIRDPLYNLVAANRYRFFGKKESCRIPSPEERSRFL